MWMCNDGRVVLFNRWYLPILQRRPGFPPEVAHVDEWVPWVRRSYFGKAALANPLVSADVWCPVLAEVNAVLRSWGWPPLPPRPPSPYRPRRRAYDNPPAPRPRLTPIRGGKPDKPWRVPPL
jgi:hypothetical protein